MYLRFAGRCSNRLRLFLAAVCCGAVTLLAALVSLVAACALGRVAALLLAAVVLLIAISAALGGCLLCFL